MLSVEYLNSQFSLLQNLDFFIRIFVACLCGALIGVERSKRFKGAGIRTHIIVCCASALMMIISKYSFADLSDSAGATLYGSKGADPSRIASQVVSGISFLGAGVIFKHGSTVRGLTTAAGLWATAGIGMAIGSGMYPIGIFAAVLVSLVQVLMHKFVVGGDSLSSNRLQFTINGGTAFQGAFDTYIQSKKMQIVDSKNVYIEDGFASYDIILRVPHEISISEFDHFLKSNGELRCISCTPIN